MSSSDEGSREPSRSGEESEEEANKSNAEESDNSDKSNANVEEGSDQEGNGDEKEDDVRSNKNTTIKFDELKLVLTNEVKIDVISKNNIEENKEIPVSNKNVNPPVDNVKSDTTQLNKSTTSLKLLLEVNNDLDDLFSSLCKSIKSFRTDSKLNSPRRIPQESQSNFTSKGVQSSEYKKVYSEKETNTTKPKNLKEYRNGSNQTNEKFASKKETKGNSDYNNHNHPNYNNYNIPNNYSNHKPQSPSYIRTVEDLYRPNKVEPVIYSSSHRVNRKQYAGESDGVFDSRDWKKEKPSYRPKDIGHAMDILLDRDDD